MLASACTNSVFGFLKTYVLLAAAAATGTAAGYDAAELAMFAWASQGLLGVVQLFSWVEVADRIRTGDIVTDLLRPVNPLVAFLAADLGRAGHALVIRLTVPIALGALFFPLRWPAQARTWLWLVISVVLATVTSFATRYLVNLLAFWWLDARGPNTLWLFGGSLFSGLAVPIPFFPEWVQTVLWCTPFPWMLQAPLDVLLERGSPVALVCGGALAAGVMLAAASLLQRIALRRLVVQGG
ncbi:ABC-2 type transport system permease protein [Cryptosporangium aurantiacum]|uniref:ABC-2 type transport system permease protein n=2 Tax=Cryptosporangium aurantiacum TaxID=134849 RepID=A0A1M7R838_9ACTN|nr:ABC-2 type transport system permease protein [Cryptosporangium aurantiacum]